MNKFKKIHFAKKQRMFNNITIDFVDRDGNPLDVIVIVGDAGVGKSTLLKTYFDFDLNNIPEINNKTYYNMFLSDELKKENKDKDIKKVNEIMSVFNLNIKLIDKRNNQLIFENSEGIIITGINNLSDTERLLYSKIIFLSSLLLPKSIIIDDLPETKIHPKQQKYLIDAYKKAGNNNQFILATNSSHILQNVPADNIFILKKEKGNTFISKPRYAKGHSIHYILSEIMDIDFRDNKLAEDYLDLIREGKHETKKGVSIRKELDKFLDPNSDYATRIAFAIRRYFSEDFRRMNNMIEKNKQKKINK